MRVFRSLGIMAGVLAFLAVALPAAGESRIEKDLDLQPNGQFVLESDMGSVTVTGVSRSGAHIVITSEREDLNRLLDFNFSGSAALARVTAKRKPESGWSHGHYVRFEIQVPIETRTMVRTGGGPITLSGLRGESNVKTLGGPIEVTGLSGNLEARTSGGPIRLREVTGDARVDTSGGPIDVEALEREPAGRNERWGNSRESGLRPRGSQEFRRPDPRQLLPRQPAWRRSRNLRRPD